MDPNDLVAQLARLSALDLGAEARERLATELPNILSYVTTLATVDTSEVMDDHLAAAACRLRADVAADPLPREVVLPPPPRGQDGHFIVPAWRDLEAD